MSPLHFAGKIYTLQVLLYGMLLINVIFINEFCLQLGEVI